MPRVAHLTNRLAIAICLMVFISCALFLTYGGEFISTDEAYLFDATESLARRGNLELNLTTSVRPMMAQDSEPMHAIAAAPLFWLVERLPGVGMVHGMLLFNNLVTAAAAGLLFFYGLALGYRAGAALVVAALFGVGTIAWPYSKTFFSEPLLSFWLLLSAYTLERWRQAFDATGKGWRWLAAGGGAFAAALLTKQAGILALPALLVVVVPGSLTAAAASLTAVRARRSRPLRATRPALVIGAAAAALAAASLVFTGLGERIVTAAGRADLTWLLEASLGYTISPGKSIFIYSPTLVLGLIGILALARRKQRRQAAVPLAMALSFVLGYAVLHKANWMGGLGWGARYMVPLTAFLLLPALPVIERLLAKGPTWARVAATYLALLSVGVQVLGTIMPVHNYYFWIRGGTAWDVGVWAPAQTHLFINFVLFRLFGNRDVAWWVLGRDLSIPTLCAALMAAALAAMVYFWRRGRVAGRQVVALAAASAMLLGGLWVFALTRYTARDDRYLVSDAALGAMLDYLGQHAAPDDVVLLSNPRYQLFFYNFNKAQRLYIVPLPNSPGDQADFEPTPLRPSDNPDHLVEWRIPRVVHDKADAHDTLWLVVDANRYVPGSVRAVEQWMARHYFPIDQYEVTPQVRVVRYSAADPPPPSVPPWPARRAGAVFAGTFTLIGYDLIGEPYRPGDAVNVSLLWRVERAPDTDYTVGLFVIGPDGAPVAERHSEPVGGFGQTYFWKPGEVWRDNHALRLPERLSPGVYTLRLILYTWRDGARLPVAGAGGAALGDFLDMGTITIQ